MPAAPAELALLAPAAVLAAFTLQLVARNVRWAGAPVAPAGPWRAPATVLLPVRGEHQGLEANLRALASQEDADYEVVVIADTPDDPSAQAARRLQAELPRLRIVLADPDERSAGWGSGKIAALVSGLAQARAASEVIVFADADIRPSPRWLAALLAPLGDPAVGGVTGFQAYRAASQPSMWTALRDAAASRAMEMMFRKEVRFMWGGSMAVRRRDLDRSTVRQEWKRHVCDDVAVTEAMRGLGLRIAFAPGAIVAAHEDWSRREVLDWMVRQIALARTIDPKATRPIAAFTAASIAVQLLALALVAAWPSTLLGFAGVGLLLPTLAAPVRAALRERLVRRALGAPRPAGEMARHLLLIPWLPWVTLWAIAKASRERAIRWRGRSYAIGAPRS